MALDSNLVFLWPGTHASIPAGWERDTRFDDGLYLKGAEAASDPTTGGAATHTHPNTSTSHTHTMGTSAVTVTDQVVLGLAATSGPSHTHASANSASATFSGAATNNDPPYYDMIFIKPTTGAGCPDDGIGFWDDAALPTDWAEHAGSKTYLLRGAASGGNAGGTGGNATHAHNTDHAHGAATSGGVNKTGAAVNCGGSTDFKYSGNPHTHQVSLASGSANVGTASTDPAWYKLRAIQNGTGGEDLPDQIIALWLGTHAGIPANWARLTAVDGVFLKCASNDGEVGDTGGATTHIHAGANHNHSGSDAGSSSWVSRDEYGTPQITAARVEHGHTWTIGNTSKGLEANSSKSHYPSFQEAIFVRYTTPAGGPTLRLLASTGVGK